MSSPVFASLPRPANTCPQPRRALRWLAVSLAAALLAGCGGSSTPGPAGTSSAPTSAPVDRPVVAASLAEARALLDLTTLPLPEGAEVSAQATSAALSWRMTGELEPVFAAQQSQLASMGWELAGDAQVYPQSASGVFSKDGYTLSLNVMPERAGTVTVQYLHHGNVDLTTLSPPAGIESRFSQPLSAIWEASTAPDAAAQRLHDSLLAAGWEAYGVAGPMRYYRQNAVRLSAMASASPSGGKSTLQLGVELLSAEIPLPAGASEADFSPSTQTLRFQHPGPVEPLVVDFGQRVAAQGWRQSLESLTVTDGKQVMTWRNAADDMLMLEFAEPQGSRTNAAVSYQTAAQIAAMNQRLDEQAEAWRKAQKE